MTFLRTLFQSRQNRSSMSVPPNEVIEALGDKEISKKLNDTVQLFTGLFAANDDFISRRFDVFGTYPAVMFYFTDLANQSVVNEELLKSLMTVPQQLRNRKPPAHQLQRILMNDVLYHSKAHTEALLQKVVEACFRGDTIIVVDGFDHAVIVGTRFIEKRAIDSPKTEQAVRGAREGFIEPIGTNISLLRYRLPTPDFRVKAMEIGRRTKTKVAVCYVEGIVNPSLVEEVFKRLSAIDIDGLIDSGYLEQFIEDNHWSPFPQVLNTERPDKTVSNLLEGRVAIIMDGSPIVLIVPALFNQFYQTVDDYSERFLMGSLVRIIRLFALVASLVLSALYVSVMSYNPDLIPTQFAIAVAGGRAGVPYPAFVEVLFMEIAMEVLREATLRLPEQVGGAISIVGVLVIGQAAVSAGFVSPITVVVIALTTIGSFATPAYNAAIALRMLRFLLIGLAGILGLYGVMIGLVIITNHILSLRSFGVRYLSPVAPIDWQAMKDGLIRAPLWQLRKRPGMLYPQDTDRISEDSIKAATRPRKNVLDPSTLLQRGKRGNR